MGLLVAFLLIIFIVGIWYFPNTNSISYRIGRSLGDKIKSFGDDDKS